ncbi:phosphoribosyl carboxyaminoimidazole mutase [Streptococcus pyogenes]|nr:phosphoribosyl carboxyaminoimidazole mutase [Streptococcus pyogenes]VHC85641.1 phosphoribosylaminoimidazole carboxylase catalytic subunit [Streptococcus pyogenes]
MLKHLVALTWVRLRNQRFRTYRIFFYGNFRQVETPLYILIMKTPIISIIMGSKSDWATMQKTAEVLDNFGIAYEKKVVSAHRTPDLMFKHAEEARGRGIKIIIAGAGGAAHLPGMVAAKTTLPVIGVPVKSRVLSGLDSLYSIVQMPGGVPVATMAIGEAGATNAALTALRILSIEDQNLADALAHFHEEQGKIAEESSGELI